MVKPDQDAAFDPDAHVREIDDTEERVNDIVYREDYWDLPTVIFWFVLFVGVIALPIFALFTRRLW